MRIFYFDSWWDWPTFILYTFISLLTVALIKNGEKNARYIYINGIVKKKYGVIGNFFYIAVFSILVMFSALRSYEVGIDAFSYVNNFLNATNFEFNWKAVFTLVQGEPLYELYIFLLRKITSNYHIYFFVTYAIITYCFIYFIRSCFDKKSHFVVLILFILSYVYNFSAIRSGLSEALILISFCCLKDKKVMKAILFTVIAALIHYTAIVNILFIIFYKIYSSKLFKNRVVITLSIVIFIASSNYIIALLSEYILSTKYRYYLNYKGTVMGNAFII